MVMQELVRGCRSWFGDTEIGVGMVESSQCGDAGIAVRTQGEGSVPSALLQSLPPQMQLQAEQLLHPSPSHTASEPPGAERGGWRAAPFPILGSPLTNPAGNNPQVTGKELGLRRD